MGTFTQLQAKFEQLNTDKIASDAVDQTKESLIALNKKQLLAGFDKEGNLIGDKKPYQSKDYAFYKANINPLPGLGNPDLHDTGAFFAGFEVEVQDQDIIEDSTDEKSAELQEKYGEIFGLGGEYKEQYIDESLRPAFAKGIEQATGLKLN